MRALNNANAISTCGGLNSCHFIESMTSLPVQIFQCKFSGANLSVQIFQCKFSSANFPLQIFQCKSSSANLPVKKIFRCISSGYKSSCKNIFRLRIFRLSLSPDCRNYFRLLGSNLHFKTR